MREKSRLRCHSDKRPAAHPFFVQIPVRAPPHPYHPPDRFPRAPGYTRSLSPSFSDSPPQSLSLSAAPRDPPRCPRYPTARDNASSRCPTPPSRTADPLSPLLQTLCAPARIEMSATAPPRG